MVDMYIDSSEPSENVGQIHFSLEYDFQNTTLILKVIQVSYIKRNAIKESCKNDVTVHKRYSNIGYNNSYEKSYISEKMRI